MSKHPLNLALRFALELAALTALGYWAWTMNGGLWRWVLVVALPLLAAGIWGSFRVPGDPGNAPIPVPGIVRLAIEALFFGASVLALANAGRETLAMILAAIVLIHYAISFDRIVWLVRR